MELRSLDSIEFWGREKRKDLSIEMENEQSCYLGAKDA